MILKGLNILTAREFLNLITAVNWGTEKNFTTDGLNLAISSSTQIYGIRNDNGELVAISRVLSDNYLFSTVPEILVHPDYQKKGFGKMLMEEVKKDFSHTAIFFGAQPGNEGFFENLGFQRGMQSFTSNRELPKT